MVSYNKKAVDTKVDEFRVFLFDLVQDMEKLDYEALLELLVSEVEQMPEHKDL